MSSHIDEFNIFSPDLIDVLQAVFDDIWDEVGPSIPDYRKAESRKTISQALMALAHAGQRSPDRLRAYARSRVAVPRSPGMERSTKA